MSELNEIKGLAKQAITLEDRMYIMGEFQKIVESRRFSVEEILKALDGDVEDYKQLKDLGIREDEIDVTREALERHFPMIQGGMNVKLLKEVISNANSQEKRDLAFHLYEELIKNGRRALVDSLNRQLGIDPEDPSNVYEVIKSQFPALSPISSDQMDELERMLSLARVIHSTRLEGAFLLKINEVREIQQTIETVKFEKLPDVMLPPDEREIKIGNGDGDYEELKVFPRTQYAIEVLTSLGVDLSTCTFLEGTNTSDMMRQLSYKTIVVPKLGKTIFVCDEEGNRTFVIHNTNDPKRFYELRKSQLKELVEVGDASDLVWCDSEEWKWKLATLLTQSGSAPVLPASPTETDPDKEAASSVPPAPEGWMTCTGIAQKLEVTFQRVERIVKKFKKSNPDWFKKFKVSNGRNFEHCSPELIKIIKEETEGNRKISIAPKGWKTNHKISKELGVYTETVRNIAKKYHESNPEWFKEYKVKKGHVLHEHYSPELCEKIKRELEEYEYAPDGWKTNNILANLLGVNYSSLRRRVGKYRKSNPEWFKEYKTARNQVYEHYAPELCEKIKEEIEGYKKPPKGWMNANELALLLKSDHGVISYRVNALRNKNEHPEWFKEYKDNGGRITWHYAPELCEKIREEIEKYNEPPEGWMTKNQLRKKMKKSQSKIENITNSYRSSNPEWFKFFKHPKTGICEYYAPELCEKIKEEIEKYNEPPEGWMTNGSLADSLNVSKLTISRKANPYHAEHPEWFKKFNPPKRPATVHYAPELCALIKEELTQHKKAPDGWITNRGLANKIKVDDKTTKKIADKYRNSNPEWFKKFKDSVNQPREHFSPELIAIIEKELDL